MQTLNYSTSFKSIQDYRTYRGQAWGIHIVEKNYTVTICFFLFSKYAPKQWPYRSTTLKLRSAHIISHKHIL